MIGTRSLDLHDPGKWCHGLFHPYDGQTITYDTIGNPLTYRGKSLYWSGRQLNNVVNSGSTSITSFTYNAAGQRIEKTVNRDVTKYYYDDAGRLIGQTDGDRTIQFCWDMAANTMLGFVSGGVRYWYRKNQQGDVTGIFATNNAASEMLVEYEYTMPGAIVSPSPAQAQTLLASGTP